MTRIRRPPAKQQRWTLVSVMFGISGILLLTIYLFQLDAFPKRKAGGSLLNRKGPAITPEKLLAQEFIRKRDMSDGGGGGGANTEGGGGGEQAQQQAEGQDDGEDEEDEEEEEEDAEEEQAAEEVIQREEESNSEASSLHPRRFALELANLRDGASGTIVVETRPKWAPIGVQHFHKLLEAQFFTDCRFFRVVKNFVAQFGIAADPKVQQEWRTDVIKDDPVVQSNKRGTLTFATSGKDTRTTQVFINFKDNAYLDGQGFAPIAEVVSGLEYLDQINDEYGEKPSQNKIGQLGNSYLQHKFPNLSYIKSVREVTSNNAAAEE